MNSDSQYAKTVSSRNSVRFYLGALARVNNYLRNTYAVRVARRKGAKIGKYVSLPIKLARTANHNLSIGEHTSIQTCKLDLRAPVIIGSHVIIGSNVEILTCSHNIDSPDWEFKSYGILIEDYVWIATNALILPSCTLIEKGAVIGSGSVVSSKVKSMNIVAGNPASFIRERKEVHFNLCVEALRGNDLITYLKIKRK
jgi:acetyltransferase-like isoleucine patch superfamily enzyme